MNKLLNDIESALSANQLNDALLGYAALMESNPDFYLQRPFTLKNQRVHVQNAANMSRRKLFDMTLTVSKASPRIKAAVEHFVGLKPVKLPEQQQASFFYVPGLRGNAYYDESEFSQFKTIRQQVQVLLDAYASATPTLGTKNYLDDFDNLPNTNFWQKLNQNNWLSTSLVKAGNFEPVEDETLVKIRDLVSNNALAMCPPHAPEMFISTLKPDAYIPPHFGLSNVKLTAHLPLKVSPKAWLEVKGERRYWENCDYLIFDDSLLHSAANESPEDRSVLIFDLWHPDLSIVEKSAVTEFMVQHDQWHKAYGKLAAVDKGTY